MRGEKLTESRSELTDRIAHRLVQARRRAHLSQIAVAKRLDIRPNTLSGWESGKRMPRAPQLAQLSRIYGCTTDDLTAQSDRANGLPESVLLLDEERVDAVLRARSPEEIGAVVDWQPQMIPFWQVVEPAARICSHRQVQELSLRLSEHVRSIAP